MEQFIESFSAGGEYILRLIVAMVLGGVIGLERQVRGRSAGLRTNILVCLGSAAVIVASAPFEADPAPARAALEEAIAASEPLGAILTRLGEIAEGRSQP